MPAINHSEAHTNANPFDWQQGRWTAPGAPTAEAEILITSDWAPIRKFAPMIAMHPEAVYGDLLGQLRDADLRITNLECPLTSRNTPVHKSGSVLSGGPEHVPGLTAVPFDVVTLGNNHLFDHGIHAFEETLDLLAANDTRWLGAGMSAAAARVPLGLDVNGIRLALVNFSEGEDLTATGPGPGVYGWEVERVVEQVTSLKARADIIVVICHCGVEYIPFPPPYVAEAFERIARAGAHLIIGHHPHVPQGVAVHHGVPICYSLGNFVFYQQTDLFYRKCGYMVSAGLTRDGLAHVKLIPYTIGDQGLTQMEGEARSDFFKQMAQISAPLEDEHRIRDAWNGFLGRYGLDGFQAEIAMLLEKMDEDLPKGAAMFRNRIATMQHNQHWIDALSRIMDGSIDDAPQWALDLNARWMTRRC
jgi:poly-gamma-glutamate synthesis protein (capsule biosynthesis protein)